MNVLVVEDELQTANLLIHIIEKDKRFKVIDHLDSIINTINYFNENNTVIDLMFLDIELSDGHAFEIFNHINISVPIIFCTAYDEFSLKAIKNNGIDYILKPFKDEEILLALQKYIQFSSVFQKQTSSHLNTQLPNKKHQEHFITHYRHQSIIVPSKNIALIALEHQTIYIYTLENDKYVFHKNMNFIESVCNPNNFFRINRQMIVHKKAIQSIEPFEPRKLLVHLDIDIEHHCVVSRLKVSGFKKWLHSF